MSPLISLRRAATSASTRSNRSSSAKSNSASARSARRPGAEEFAEALRSCQSRGFTVPVSIHHQE